MTLLHLLHLIPFAFLHTPAIRVHDQWSDATPVETATKKACCGEAEAHHLRPEQVHAVPGGWLIDGYHGPAVVGGYPVPYDKVLPSPDGQIWVFWSDIWQNGVAVNSSPIRCVFMPPQGF